VLVQRAGCAAVRQFCEQRHGLQRALGSMRRGPGCAADSGKYGVGGGEVVAVVVRREERVGLKTS
jgi:hypothetical protein